MMEFFSDWLYHHKTLVIAFIILLLGGIGGAFAMTYDLASEENLVGDAGIQKEEIEKTQEEEPPKEEEQTEEKPAYTWRIDIKGAVANPGVYEVGEETRIYEAIAMAGGLIDSATTENINLSKKVSDEMVIYIFTKEEYQTKTTCVVENDSPAEISRELNEKTSVIEKSSETARKDKKVSLNSANKEELMTLTGIGEAKAESIINYRTEKGGFQNIEELKNVTGIGESLYEKIKEHITL